VQSGKWVKNVPKSPHNQEEPETAISKLLETDAYSHIGILIGIDIHRYPVTA
jgi:hypothetical protein